MVNKIGDHTISSIVDINYRDERDKDIYRSQDSIKDVFTRLVTEKLELSQKHALKVHASKLPQDRTSGKSLLDTEELRSAAREILGADFYKEQESLYDRLQGCYTKAMGLQQRIKALEGEFRQSPEGEQDVHIQHKIIKLEHNLAVSRLKIRTLKKQMLDNMSDEISPAESEVSQGNRPTNPLLQLDEKINTLSRKYLDESTGLKKIIVNLRQKLSSVNEQMKNSYLSKMTEFLSQKIIGTKVENYDLEYDVGEMDWEAPWGKLLISHTHDQEIIGQFWNKLGMGFKETHDGILAAKTGVQKEKEALESKCTALERAGATLDDDYLEFSKDLTEKTKALHAIDVYLQHVVLSRMIDIIGKKQNTLKKDREILLIEPAKLEKLLSKRQESEKMRVADFKQLETYDKQIKKCREKIAGAEARISTNKKALIVLENKYKEDYPKYCKMAKPEQSLAQFALHVAGLEKLLNKGYISTAYVTPRNLAVKKAYADKGYDMWDEMKKIVGDSHAPSIELLTRHCTKFMKWSDQQPEIASQLFGDLALTCSIMKQDDLVTSLHDTFQASVYFNASLGELGRVKPNQKIEISEEAITYKALADFSSYLPISAGLASRPMNVIMKGAFEATLSGISNTIISGPIVGLGAAGAAFGKRLTSDLPEAVYMGILDGAKGNIIQRFSNEINPDHKEVALLALKAIRGDNAHDIIIAQRNLETVRIAGDLRHFLDSPTSLIKGAVRSIKINLKSIVKAETRREKVYRILGGIVAPFATFAGFVASSIFLSPPILTSALAFFGPPGWILIGILWTGIAIAAIWSALTVQNRANRLINSLPSFGKTLHKVEENEWEHYVDQGLGKEKVQKEADTYLHEAREQAFLPPAFIQDSYMENLLSTKLQYQKLQDQMRIKTRQIIEKLNAKSNQRSINLGDYLSDMRMVICPEVDQVSITALIGALRAQLTTDLLETRLNKDQELDKDLENDLTSYMSLRIIDEVVNDWLKPKLIDGIKNGIFHQLRNDTFDTADTEKREKEMEKEIKALEVKNETTKHLALAEMARTCQMKPEQVKYLSERLKTAIVVPPSS